MLVDSSDGHVRSGNDGAVFVRLRPTTTVHKENLYDNPSNSWKQVTNVIPEQYPYDIQKYEFKWRDARGYSGSSSSRSGTSECMRFFYHFLLKLNAWFISSLHFLQKCSTGTSRIPRTVWRPLFQYWGSGTSRVPSKRLFFGICSEFYDGFYKTQCNALAVKILSIQVNM